MNQRERWRRRKAERKAASDLPASPRAPLSAPAPRRMWMKPALFALAVLAVLLLGSRIWVALEKNRSTLAVTRTDQLPDAPDPKSKSSEPFNPKKESEKDPDSFLDAFNEMGSKEEKEADGALLSDEELEIHFRALVGLGEQIDELKQRAAALEGASEREFADAVSTGNRLQAQFDRKAALLEKRVGQAVKARPTDALPRWLTGELLALVGGDPEEIQPHLEFAVRHGLQRPRLLGTLAYTRLESNRFDEAYRTAMEGLDQLGRDRYLWNIFVRVAFRLNRYDEVIERIERAFPKEMPQWAKEDREEATGLRAKWDAEQKIRAAESRADDLPRVRLLIEHRRFARDSVGKPLTTIESTGREEVIVELFENEAPLSVANFIELSESGFYNGTTFHLAVPARGVVGGDPNTKNDDPSDDGAGGPGYVIADEFAKGARNHFRGTLSMFHNDRPHSAGSQFFLSLSPQPGMDGHFTVFGRVVDRQQAIDQITRGRTTRAVGLSGRIIPGDLLVRVEVLRKRNHAYRAVKEKP